MSILPALGLGLSSNLDARARPNPYALLAHDRTLFDFVEYSAPLDVEEAQRTASLFDEMFAKKSDVRVLFHPVHLNLYGPTLESTQALHALDAHARAVHSPWVGNDVGWWHEGGQPFPGYLYIPPPLTEGGVADCAAHALHVQSHLSMPLLLENPVVVVRRGKLHVLDFMAKLHARTGLGLILDVGHLFSHALATGQSPTSAFDGFPFDQVFELHIAGGVVTKRGDRSVYFDDHTQPIREEVFSLLAEVLPRCRNLRALVYEGDGHPEPIAVRTLSRLRQLWTPSAVEVETERPRPAQPLIGETKAWQLFDESHARAKNLDDPDGLQADLDIRLAVLAERLDCAFPLSRLLVAPRRETLIRFVSSEDFRSMFTESRALIAAWTSFARAETRRDPEHACSAALAFETWAHRAAHSHARPPPPAAHVVLAPGWQIASFPFDFTEALFAARALKRHLLARAWATQTLPEDPLEGLAQAVKRAPKGPWLIALRFLGGVLEAKPIPMELSAAVRPIARSELSEAVVKRALSEGLLICG